MKIPVWVLSIVLTAVIGEQAWLVNSVNQLKTDVAVIKSRTGTTAQNKFQELPCTTASGRKLSLLTIQP